MEAQEKVMQGLNSQIKFEPYGALKFLQTLGRLGR
jgi:hypothetical protein